VAGLKLIAATAAGRPRIDRYELVAEIASGGMATVFLARLSGVGGFQRFVALKRLHPHLATEQEFVQMFLDEARLAACLHHPNVVAILEVGASDQGYYLVMEYVEGDTLASLLARAATAGTRLPTGVAIRVITDMLAGLHAAHELRDELGNPTELVHRDVSPQNVLVGADGISRITDFGVARAASRLGASRVGQLKGKIAYMAPEQTAGETLDRRADVFAAGIVLWEALAGRRLFRADNEAATISRILKEPITSPRRYNSDVNQAVANVCMQALERDAARRFATAAVFAEALEVATTTSPMPPIASHREIAAYVNEATGGEIAQQRELVRAWLARTEASFSQGPAASSVSAAAMSVPGRRDGATGTGRTPTLSVAAAADSRPWVPLVGGMLLAAAIVGGAVLYASNRGREASVPAAPALPAEPSGLPTRPAKPEPSAEPAHEQQPDAGAKPDVGETRPSARTDADDRPGRDRQPVSATRHAPPSTVQAPVAPTRPDEPASTRPEPTSPKRPDDMDFSNPYR
jgi:serine/threonine protein kinase